MTQYYPIKLIRMMSGEVIVAGIANGGNDSYIFEKPMVLVAVALPNQKPNMPQEVTVMLRDWMEFSDDVYYIIPKKAVMCIMKPNRDIVADYTQAKIQSDIMSDMIENGMVGGNKTVEDLEKESDGDEDEDDAEFEEGHDEFPGWGGDPRLG
jgi:hypothetical protein